MPKPKKNNTSNRNAVDANGGQTRAKTESSDDNDVVINMKESSITEFTQRPVPSEAEVEEFDEIIDDETKEEAIDESLNEIYQDDNGDMVDVKKLEIKRKHGFLFWIFTFLFIMGGLAAAGYAAYHYFYIQPGSDATAVEFYIESQSEVNAGEEFFYTINYKNSSNINIENAHILVNYPDNFIFLDSSPESSDAKNKNLWNIDSIPAHYNGKIRIKGMLIGPKDETQIFLASLDYVPQNFSSEFKKEAPFTITIKDIGLELDADYISSALVDEENEIKLKITPQDKNYLNNFRLRIDPQENIDFINVAKDDKDPAMADFTIVRPGIWQVNNISNTESYLPIKFKFNKKVSDSQDLTLIFEHAREVNISTSTEEAKYYKFYEKTLNFEVMKSDLNLTLIINGSREDQGVDFGQTLNYSINYKNAGENDLKNVVVMAVLDSDFLNFDTLTDANKGVHKGNTISWSKEEIGALEDLSKNQEGVIDFSIAVSDLGQIDKISNYQVKSYAQFSVGDKTDISANSDNRSNTIINKINSDLSLKEEVRYFSSDNIPVGTGPNPPKVGETTTYKVYWDLSNNLHELSGLKIKVKLPDYINWNEKTQTTVGNIGYDSGSREVTWDIGRLPVTVYRALAEFSISVTPRESDKNTIMVLLPGTNVSATDSITQDTLAITTKAKTTKLEDDNIATGDGIVE